MRREVSGTLVPTPRRGRVPLTDEQKRRRGTFGRVAAWCRWSQPGVLTGTTGGCTGCRTRPGCKACGPAVPPVEPEIGGRFGTISGCLPSSSGRRWPYARDQSRLGAALGADAASAVGTTVTAAASARESVEFMALLRELQAGQRELQAGQRQILATLERQRRPLI